MHTTKWRTGDTHVARAGYRCQPWGPQFVSSMCKQGISGLDSVFAGPAEPAYTQIAVTAKYHWEMGRLTATYVHFLDMLVLYP